MYSGFGVQDSDEILAPAWAGMRIASPRCGAIGPSYWSWRGGMHSGFWVQDSDEILAPAQAGMRIAPSRSGAIEPSYRSWRGGMYLHQGLDMRCPRIISYHVGISVTLFFD